MLAHAFLCACVRVCVRACVRACIVIYYVIKTNTLVTDEKPCFEGCMHTVLYIRGKQVFQMSFFLSMSIQSNTSIIQRRAQLFL